MIAAERAESPSGNGGLGTGRLDTPLDRVLRALNHPLRRRILRTLVDGKESASSLSKKLRVNLGLISYHLNQVLNKECEVVELVEMVPRRGAVEKIYRLKFQALTEGDSIPGSVAPGPPRAMSLEECFIVAVAAMEGGAFEAVEDSWWDWFRAQVDAEGWREICAASEDFTQRARAAIDSGRERTEGEATRDVVVGAAAFPAASPPPAA